MTRVFTPQNAPSATVYEVETKRKLERVLSVDIDTGEVCVFRHPFLAIGDELATESLRFQSIHPIYGGNLNPVLFHCYERMA